MSGNFQVNWDAVQPEDSMLLTPASTPQLPPVRQNNWWNESASSCSAALDESTTVGKKRKLLPKSAFTSVLDLTETDAKTSPRRPVVERLWTDVDGEAVQLSPSVKVGRGGSKPRSSVVRDSLNSVAFVAPRQVEPACVSEPDLPVTDVTVGGKVACPFCRKLFQKKNVEKHASVTCPGRIVKCEVCSKKITARTVARHMKTHAKDSTMSTSCADMSVSVCDQSSSGSTRDKLTGQMDGEFRRPLPPAKTTRSRAPSVSKRCRNTPSLDTSATRKSSRTPRTPSALADFVKAPAGSPIVPPSAAKRPRARPTTKEPCGIATPEVGTGRDSRASLLGGGDPMELTPMAESQHSVLSEDSQSASTTTAMQWLANASRSAAVEEGTRNGGQLSLPSNYTLNSVLVMNSASEQPNFEDHEDYSIWRPYFNLEGAMDVFFMRVLPGKYTDPQFLTEHHMVCTVVAGTCHVVEETVLCAYVETGGTFQLPYGKQYVFSNQGTKDLVISCLKVRVQPGSCHFLPLTEQKKPFEKCSSIAPPLTFPAIKQ